MDPFSAIAGVIGLITSVIGIASSVKQIKDEDETTAYNRNLNERVFEREDNAWQRAVNDRSKAGLSISGLTSGAGAGGTVSQLQAPQSAGKMADLMKGLGDTSFGLAQNAYDRKLQKENFTEELKVKKEQLKVDRLNARYQRLKTLADLGSVIQSNKRENAIYEHNMKIAQGKDEAKLWQVYGSQPSEIKELLNALVNNKDKILGGAKQTVEGIKDNVSSKVDNAIDNIKDFFNPPSYKQIPDTILNQLTNSTRVFVNSSAWDIENVYKDTRDGTYKMKLRDRSNGKNIYYDIPESDLRIIINYFQKNPFKD